MPFMLAHVLAFHQKERGEEEGGGLLEADVGVNYDSSAENCVGDGADGAEGEGGDGERDETDRDELCWWGLG
jgi:hypothetical protein